jgi:hypothetical protein
LKKKKVDLLILKYTFTFLFINKSEITMGPYLALSISNVGSGTNITSSRGTIPFVLNISNLKSFKPRVPTFSFRKPDKKKKKKKREKRASHFPLSQIVKKICVLFKYTYKKKRC